MSIPSTFPLYEEGFHMIPYLVRSGSPRKNSFSNSVSDFITGWKRIGLLLFTGVCFILLYLLVTGGPEEVVPLSLFPCPFFHLQYIHCRRRYRHSYSTNTSWHVITSPLFKSHYNPFHLLDPETEHSDLQTSSRMCLVSSSTRN